MRARSCIPILMLASLVILPACGEDLNLEGARVKTYKTVGDVELKAYMFYPPNFDVSKPAPSIVFFFGGGWKSGSPKQFEQHCNYFAQRGLIAITADYRVLSRHGVPAKECVADAKSMIRWMRKNAEKLGIDPERIVASGGSAGGHLAASTAVVKGLESEGEDLNLSSRPNALALFNPALVLASVEGFDIDQRKLESLKKRVGVQLEKISPFHQLEPNAPPTIIFHGTKDETVPFESAKMFADAMKENGDQCLLEGFEGQGHGFFNFREGKSKENFRATVQSLDRFLVSLGYLIEAKTPEAEAILD